MKLLVSFYTKTQRRRAFLVKNKTNSIINSFVSGFIHSKLKQKDKIFKKLLNNLSHLIKREDRGE